MADFYYCINNYNLLLKNIFAIGRELNLTRLIFLIIWSFQEKPHFICLLLIYINLYVFWRVKGRHICRSCFDLLKKWAPRFNFLIRLNTKLDAKKSKSQPPKLHVKNKVREKIYINDIIYKINAFHVKF